MKRLETLKSYLIIAFGLLIYCFAWTAFVIPSEIIAGGVGGIATLIYYGTNEAIPVAYSYFAVNIVFLSIAIKILGKGFGMKTIFAILFSSMLFAVMQPLFDKSLVDEKFVSILIGAILSGVGVGITFTQGGSSGGTDIIAMIINKYKNISPGKLLLCIDAIIILSSYIVFKDIATIVYGCVYMGIFSYSLDLIISGSKQSAQLFIISDKYDEVASRISLETGRGISLIESKGWYTKENKTILMTVIRKHETALVFKIVKECDPKAFVSMGNVMGVYGLGFEEMRS